MVGNPIYQTFGRRSNWNVGRIFDIEVNEPEVPYPRRDPPRSFGACRPIPHRLWFVGWAAQ